MASAPLATDVDCGGRPMVVAMPLVMSTSGSVDRHAIRQYLRRGIAVLVQGWNPRGLVSFNIEDMEYYRPPINQLVTWQGRTSFFHSRADTMLNNLLYCCCNRCGTPGGGLQEGYEGPEV